MSGYELSQQMTFSRLMGLANGHAEARILQTAVSLGIFEALASVPQEAPAIANKLQLEPKATELLLNALAALNILNKKAQHFSLCEAAKPYLLRSSPQYVGGMIKFEDLSWQSWTKLPEAIRTGRPARPTNMYQEDPSETETFINAMDSLVRARGDTEAVITALDWQNVGELLDVGSGPATYPIALCRKFYNIRATIVDLPVTLKITERYVQGAGMTDRITLIAGDYRKDPIPGHYDSVFLSNIIHAEDSERNQDLMSKLSRNLKPRGSIVVKDHVLDESRANPAAGAIFSLLMLLTTAGGRCYSFGEIKSWMERAGLSQIQQIGLPPPLTSSLVVGTR
ncbi:MAG: methyltransferase [Candidatus Binatia bacterium]